MVDNHRPNHSIDSPDLTNVASSFQHTTLLNMSPSYHLVDDSREQDQMSFDNDEVVEKPAYILAIATVKRDLSGVSESSSSYTRHKRILDENIVTVNGIDRLFVMVDLDIEHEVVLRDGFSETQEWGRLHYFYVKVVGTQSIAFGVAALLGLLFRQDAIGITHPLSRDDHQVLSWHQGRSLSSNFHPYFTVHLANSISRDTAIEIMKCVCQCFSKISAQLDIWGKSIDFHDFSSSSDLTNEDIETILNANFDHKFVVKTKFAKSTLLNKGDYQQALHQLDLETNWMIKWDELIRKHKVHFY